MLGYFCPAKLKPRSQEFGGRIWRCKSQRFHLQGGWGWLRDSQLGQLPHPQGHLAMSRDILGGHSWGCITSPASVGGDHGRPTTRNLLEQMSGVPRWRAWLCQPGGPHSRWGSGSPTWSHPASRSAWQQGEAVLCLPGSEAMKLPGAGNSHREAHPPGSACSAPHPQAHPLLVGSRLSAQKSHKPGPWPRPG